MDIDKNARTIWNYLRMNMQLVKADAIFVLCSSDIRVASRAADLFSQDYAPWIILSGGFGKISGSLLSKPEAEVFKDVMLQSGVPNDKIIVEPNATNTGENIHFTYELLDKINMSFTSFIIVQKPYMERRSYATFKKQWPNKTTRILVTSPILSYDEYIVDSVIDKNTIINLMVGDLQRIREYPKLGFQIHQAIPDEVWLAYEKLVVAGFDKQLINTY